MRLYDKKEIKEINVMSKIICNKCGREIPVTSHGAEEGVFNVDYEWGYFSNKDGEKHSFDLCESCYDELIASFTVPVEKEG